MNAILRITIVVCAALLTVLGAGLPARTAAAAEPLDCLECHDDFTAGSVHEGAATCAECHADVRDDTHEDGGVRPVDCGSCHEDESVAMSRDIHRRMAKRVGDKGPDCKTCHGSHQVASPERSKDPVKTYCSKCHDNVLLTNPYHSLASVADQQCLECHEEAETFPKLLAASVHPTLGCSDCHAYSAKNLESHQDTLPFDQVADCSLCHKPEALEHHDSIHGISIAEGVEQAANCWNCHGSHRIEPAKSPSSPVHPENLAATCGTCHDDPKFAEKFSMSVKLPGKSYSQSVHGELVKLGRMEAANCVLCHGVHTIRNRLQPGSPIASFAVPKTCGQCHGEIAAQYERSIHWVRAKRGVKDAPVCNDCHSEHSVQGITVVQSDAKQARVIQEETCLRCHSDPVIARRYNLNPNRAATYLDSYHGLAERRGDGNVAMCVDCHGIHEILPRLHPQSMVNEDNLVQTCRPCHPEATASFAASYSHEKASPVNRRIVYWAQVIYIWMIWLVVVGMLLHNVLIFTREVRTRWRGTRQSVTIPRFTVGEVIQHFLLSLSFLLLVVTGFALTYPDLWLFRWLEWLRMTELVRQYVHRAAGVTLVALGVYHLVYLAATQRGRHMVRLLWLRLADVRAAVANVAFQLGLRKTEPEFDEFDYAEKIEYWALIWGTLVMAATGVVLWFPEAVSRHAPSWIIELSTVVHFYEAVLASLAILIWHGFLVMLHPGRYPLDFTMVDGRIALQRYAHHHRGPFKRLLLQWSQVRSGALARAELDLHSERLLAALEAAGHDPDRVLQEVLQHDPELRAWLEGQRRT